MATLMSEIDIHTFLTNKRYNRKPTQEQTVHHIFTSIADENEIKLKHTYHLLDLLNE